MQSDQYDDRTEVQRLLDKYASSGQAAAGIDHDHPSYESDGVGSLEGQEGWDRRQQPLDTHDKIGAYLEAIRRNRDEDGHRAEDYLYWGVLLAIANGAPNARELASQALQARDIRFARWYA